MGVQAYESMGSFVYNVSVDLAVQAYESMGSFVCKVLEVPCQVLLRQQCFQ